MSSYKNLSNQSFSEGTFSIVPIRYEDRLKIMNWRNEQMYHLRQNKLLTEADQTRYFNTVVATLFNTDFPSQLLFSFLEGSECIGYGGLVHINWVDKHAEISFIMDTALEKDYFQKHWTTYLKLIEQVAFQELQLHKIFTYAFDLRPHLYDTLEASGFVKDAVLKEHCFFNNEFKDVIIHSKTANQLFQLVDATIDDAKLLFDWSNDPLVRENSHNTTQINWENHIDWLTEKLKSDSKILILYYRNKAIGIIRFDNKGEYFLINYSIDQQFRGKGFGTKIIQLGLQRMEKGSSFEAIVKKDNLSSIKIFEKLNFDKQERNNPSIFYFIKKI